MDRMQENVQRFLSQFQQMWNDGDLEEVRRRFFGAWRGAVVGPALHFEHGDAVLASLRSQREFIAQLGLQRCRWLEFQAVAIALPWLRLDVLWRFEPDSPAFDASACLCARFRYVVRPQDSTIHVVLSHALDLKQAYAEFAERAAGIESGRRESAP